MTFLGIDGNVPFMPTEPRGGPFENPMAGLFEELEQQAEALHLSERDAEVADRAPAEYAAVTLAARLHASLGLAVRLGVVGLGAVQGEVRRVGPEWLGLRGGRGTAPEGPVQDWFVRLAAVRSVRGASSQAVGEPARPVTARLGIGSVLRGLARDRVPVVVHQIDGSSSAGRVRRVGADFVELVPAAPGRAEPATELVSLRWVAAIRSE